MSISSEDKHETSFWANIGRVAISCSWLNACDYTIVRFSRAWRSSLHSCTNTSIVHATWGDSTHLSLSHLGIVGIKTLVGILYDERILHRNRSRRGKSTFLFLVFSFSCAILFLLRWFSSLDFGGELGGALCWALSRGAKVLSSNLGWRSVSGSHGTLLLKRVFEAWRLCLSHLWHLNGISLICWITQECKLF